METFNFVPNSLVPETLPPEPVDVISMNGWPFSARPSVPYQKQFKVTLHGMHWYLQSNGLYDTTTNPTHNARLLEQFYEEHGTWKPFEWTHPHFGLLVVKFRNAVTVPRGKESSSGFIDPFEINLVHYNPGYSS